jgi:hypothetical protein
VVKTAAGNTLVVTRCERCHSPNNWRGEKFNHDTQTTYKLEGAHRVVPCKGCHKPQPGSTYVRYKPLNRACSFCHADQSMTGRKGKV